MLLKEELSIPSFRTIVQLIHIAKALNQEDILLLQKNNFKQLIRKLKLLKSIKMGNIDFAHFFCYYISMDSKRALLAKKIDSVALKTRTLQIVTNVMIVLYAIMFIAGIVV